MKVCLVNVRNCINYSQYGPFFFEHIKSGDCVIYNDVTSMDDLDGLYNFILSEINRNAFVSDKVKLIFLIPRNMISPTVQDYEFFNNVSIYTAVLSKLKIFSEVSTFYFDNCYGEKGAESQRRCKRVSDTMYTDDATLGAYLPVCDCSNRDVSCLRKRIEAVTHKQYREFYLGVLDEFAGALEEENPEQLMVDFTVKCVDKTKNIIRNVVEVSPGDIAGNIRETLRVVYFIKSVIDNPGISLAEAERFRLDHDEVRKIVITYKKRLEEWDNSFFRKEYKTEARKKTFFGLQRAGEEKLLTQKIKSHFDKEGLLTSGDPKGNVEGIFEILDKIIYESEQIMKTAADKAIKEVKDESLYREESVGEDEDVRSQERRLLEEIGSGALSDVVVEAPGICDRIRMEHWLEGKKKEIDSLRRHKEQYELKSFLKVFAFNLLSVAVLYFIAQYSVFVKDHAFWIYGLYCAVTAVGFSGSFIANLRHYDVSINKIVESVQKKVNNFLIDYDTAIMNFQKNLKMMAEYKCLKEYVDRLDALELEKETDMKKYEWHKQRVREILLNLRHFDDYVDGAEPAEEGVFELNATLDDDVEHSKFYQMKIFTGR